MGVMACSRNNCDNIMCDTYVNGVGHVCGECQSEFRDHIKNEYNTTTLPKHQIISELNKFMNIPKCNIDADDDKVINVYDLFNK